MEVVIVFGHMGAGKTYHSEKLAAEQGLNFVEGDSLLPKFMVDRVRVFKPLTREMIELFVRVYLYGGITRAIKQAETEGKRGIVVSQALYFDDLRLELKEQLESMGFRVTFVMVHTPFFRNLKQLWSREKGLRWILYWLVSRPFFQKPTHSYIEV